MIIVPIGRTGLIDFERAVICAVNDPPGPFLLVYTPPIIEEVIAEDEALYTELLSSEGAVVAPCCLSMVAREALRELGAFYPRSVCLKSATFVLSEWN